MGLSGTFAICGDFVSAAPYLNGVRDVDGILSATVIEGKYDSTISAYVHEIAIRFDQSFYLSLQDSDTVKAETSSETSSESETTSQDSPESDQEVVDEGVSTEEVKPETEGAGAGISTQKG